MSEFRARSKQFLPISALAACLARSRFATARSRISYGIKMLSAIDRLLETGCSSKRGQVYFSRYGDKNISSLLSLVL